MTDDKDLERQYRKNLMVVASLVLMYSIAGGQMTSDLSMFGAKLNFSRPEWLEYAMVFVMCFFWWRHWQVSKPIRKDMFENSLRGFVLPSFMNERVRHDACKIFGLDEGKYISRWAYNSIQIMPENSWDNDGHFFVLNDVGFLSVTLSEHGGMCIKYRMDRVWLACSVLYRRQWLRNAIHETHFGDAILPAITTILAMTAYFSQKMF